MPPTNTKTVLLIVGMKDNGCREIVAEAFESVNGVKEVHVSLCRASATIIHETQCAAADLIAAVGQTGYGAALAYNGSDCSERRVV